MSFKTLLGTNLRAWMGSRGFLVALVAAFTPVLLTGAWLGTHQADVAVLGAPSWAPAGDLTDEQNVTFTATIANVGKVNAENFNATLDVDTPYASSNGVNLFPVQSQKLAIDKLAPGESRPITLNWTARAGAYVVVVQANSDDTLGELETHNNLNYSGLLVHVKLPNASEGPKAPGNLTGSPDATQVSDFAITALSWGDAPLRPNNTTVFNATVTNRGTATGTANVTLRVGRVGNQQMFPLQQFAQNVTLPAGQSTNVSLTWTTPQGPWWAEAFANVTSSTRDPDGSNNQLARPFVVEPGLEVQQPPPPERRTIKDFYQQVLTGLYLQFVLPLLALFYAAGVVSDEADQGALPYLLLRVRRWQIPLAKFATGYAVTAIAMVVGVVATFALLFGTPGSDIGFLTTPLLLSLVALLAYGALFTLLGVAVPHPYIVGLAFILGWEKLVTQFVEPARVLSIGQHVVNALTGCGKNPCWPLDQGVRWLPTGQGLTELAILLVATVVLVAAGAVWMTRREFDV